MKILNSLSPPKKWEREYTCVGNGESPSGCGSFLLVEESDLFRVERKYKHGESEREIAFTCPNCGAETDLYDKDYPTDFDKIKEKA